MKDDIQVISDDDGDIQVLNGGNCNMNNGNYFFYKLVNKIKSQDDIHKKVKKVNEGEWAEQKPQQNSNVRTPENRPTNLKIALKQLVNNGNDQKTEDTNKKTDTNIDTYISGTKGFEKELAGFDNAVEEAFVSLNKKPEKVIKESVEKLKFFNKDNEKTIVQDKSTEFLEKRNEHDGIPLDIESSLDPLEPLKIVGQVTVIDHNSLDQVNICNQENYTTLGSKSIKFIDTQKVYINADNKTTEDDRSLESLDSEYFEKHEDNIREDLKNLMKIAVKGLKPSLPLTLESQPIYKKKCSECDFTSENKHDLEEHEQGVHDGVVRFMCNHCKYKSFYKSDLASHQEKMHINEEDKRIIKIGCDQCQKSEEHVQCDFIEKEFRDTQLSSNLQCLECKYNCTKKKILRRHIKIVHRKELRYECSTCKFKAFDKSYVSSHQKNEHTTGSTIIGINCKLCKDGVVHKYCDFAKPGRFLKRIDKQKKNLKCTQCSFVTGFILYLKGHIKLIHSAGATPLLVKNCNHCEFQTLKSQSMRIHVESKHDIEESFVEGSNSKKCPSCKFITNSTPSLNFHKRTQHANDNWYNCDKCDMKSWFKKRVLRHITLCHQDIEAQVRRIGCSKCQSNTEHIQCDVSSKQKKKPAAKKKYSNLNEYNCKLCTFVGHSHKMMMTHMKTYHQNDKLYDCDSCEYKCNWLPNLRTHQQAKHSGTKFECELCGWKTAWKPPFFEHKRVVHGVFKRNSKYKTDLEHSEDLCDLCGFTANSKRSMRLHKSSDCEMKSNPSVNRVKTYKQLESRTEGEGSTCTHCVQLAGSPKALAQHITAVHNMRERYRNCKECGFQATSLFHLNTHKYESHRLGENSCSVCELKCKNRFSLLIHISGKHPKTGLACDLCDFKAKSISLLKQHKEYIHMGKEYVCPICEYKGKSKALLHLHRMRVHSAEYLKCNDCGFMAENYNFLKVHQLENHVKIKESH